MALGLLKIQYQRIITRHTTRTHSLHASMHTCAHADIHAHIIHVGLHVHTCTCVFYLRALLQTPVLAGHARPVVSSFICHIDDELPAKVCRENVIATKGGDLGITFLFAVRNLT